MSRTHSVRRVRAHRIWGTDVIVRGVREQEDEDEEADEEDDKRGDEEDEGYSE
jgi:hypothetical protein